MSTLLVLNAQSRAQATSYILPGAYRMYCCRAGFLLASVLTSADMTPVLHRLSVRTLLATKRIFSKLTNPSINVSLPMFKK